MLRELGHVMADAARRDAIPVSGLTDEGRPCCVGADFGWFAGESPGRDRTPRFRAMAAAPHAVFDQLEALEEPVIAAINGLCLGGGGGSLDGATAGVPDRPGQSLLLATTDAAEGARAFRAKRRPTFTGR